MVLSYNIQMPGISLVVLPFTFALLQQENHSRLPLAETLVVYRDAILKSPATFSQADVIIIESTYGNSLHDLHQPTPDKLLEWIEKTCIKKKGKLIIPAFSVGRTQELLFALNQLELERRLPEVDYFVDSPLSVHATAIVKKYPQDFNSRIRKVLENDDDPFNFAGLEFVKTVDESKLLNFRSEPCVIISASGMADAGRVKHTYQQQH